MVMSGNIDRRAAIKLAGAGAALLSVPGRALAQYKTTTTTSTIPVELSMGGTKGAFKKHPKAAILSYPIRFIMGAEANAGGNVGIFLTLSGPSELDMQILAEEARDDLAARLLAINYGVVDPKVMLADPAVVALPKVPGNARWDEGTLDPMGKRFWYVCGSPNAPLLPQWGSPSGSSEFMAMAKMTVPSRALDAVVLIPNLTLEFSTLSGSVKGGSKGSTSWAGGDILFGFKPHSITYFMAGGKRSIEMQGGDIRPKGRVIITPVRLPGELRTGVAAPSAELAKRMGRARIDQFAVDVGTWRGWVRTAFRAYNAEVARLVAGAIA